MQYSTMLNSYKDTCFQGSAASYIPERASNPALVNMNSLIQRRAERAANLEYQLQHVKDKYAISSGENKSVSMALAKNIIKKNDKLNEKLEKNNKNDIIEKYKQGKIGYDDVEAYIEQLDTTYSTLTKTIINIATGICAMTAGISARAMKSNTKTSFIVLGASILAGAAVKVGLSIFERSKNNIKGDEFDGKQIAKDALGGAINGAFSGFGASCGKTITDGYILKRLGFETAKQGVMIGAGKKYQKHKLEKSNKVAY